jgi:hypothetical protein
MDNSRLSGFSLAPVREFFSRCCFRNELKKSITPSRLGKMLTRKGVDLQYYLYSQPTSDIMQHMRNCKRCHSLEKCDCYLDNKKMDDNIELLFCQNNDPILKVKNQQDSLYVKKQNL